MIHSPAFGLRAGARAWASLLLVLAAFLFAVPANAQTYPPLTGRVVDNAHLLNPDQVAQLTQKLEGLERATTRQLVVATVPDLQGREIEEFANGLFRQWHVGQAQANNGVLLLVSVAEHKIRIEVGYGMEGVLTDALSSQIINRDIRPRFKDGDFAGGISAGVDSIIAQLQAPPEAAERNVRQAAEAQSHRRSSGGSFLPILFWAVILIFIFIGSIARGLGGRRYRHGVSVWGPGAGYGRGDSGLGWLLTGIALSSLNRRGGGSGWGGGGGDWGGGGWGGGGGGGFSGGGGSSGGGGASGGW